MYCIVILKSLDLVRLGCETECSFTVNNAIQFWYYLNLYIKNQLQNT